MKVSIIGIGGLGSAIAAGALRDASLDVTLCSRRGESLASFGHAKSTTDAHSAVSDADVVVLCVKPRGTVALLKELSPKMRADALVVSCAAGVTLSQLQSAGRAVARAMPNIGAKMQMSTTAYCLGGNADVGRDRPRAQRLCAVIGDAFEVKDEGQLHAIAAAAASAPAWLLIASEALVDAGVQHGLSRADALRCARGALRAAAARLDEGTEPVAVRAHITSPGGMTAAGIEKIEAGAVRAAYQAAVSAAVARSKAMEGES